MNDEADKLKELIGKSKSLVAFTGAGLSSESGIPTYRGINGVWSKYDPAKYANYDYFVTDPSYYWQFFRDVRYPSLEHARPNAAHYFLVELEKRNILKQVITQNIDGLHQLAGQSNVCELHGNTRQIVCMECHKIFSMDEVFRQLARELPPYCTCKGLLKPNVVFFGESLPRQALNSAWQAAQTCDTFLVIGSSLQVYPAAQIPVTAKENGALLIIVNLDGTPLDHIADLIIHEKASGVLAIGK